jgi:hypothetical protein
MATLGLGYGSEFHLLRLLGRHRNSFDLKILSALDYQDKKIEWLDFKYDSKQFIPDREYVGIEFLENSSNYLDLKKSWSKYWPSSNRAQNWDAICKIDGEWILIEAKARKKEMKSDCTATEDSKAFISKRFDIIKNKYGINSQNDWILNYYQKANRILFLDYLADNNIKAKLLFVYFVNGFNKDREQLGVTSNSEWCDLIKKQDDYLGISDNKVLNDKITNLIIDIDK